MKTGSRRWVMDTDSLFLALAEDKLIDEKETHCITIFADTTLKPMQRKKSFAHLAAPFTKKNNKRQPGLIQEDFGCTDNLCL